MTFKDLSQDLSDLYFRFIDLEFFGFPISKVLTSLLIFGGILLARNFLVHVLLRRAQNFFAHTTLNVAHAITLTIEQPIYTFLTVTAYFTVLFPFTIPGPDEIGTVKAYINEFMIKVMGTIVSLTLFWIFFRLVDPFYAFLKKYTNLTEHEKDSAVNMHRMFSIALKIVITVIAFVTIFEKWGFNAVGFVASLSVLSAGVAFAAKDAIANVFGSVTLSLDKFVKKGDFVNFKGTVGRVQEVGYRSTVVMTTNNELVSIPNNMFANDLLMNYSRAEFQKIRIYLRINTPVNKKQILETIDEIKEYISQHSLTDETYEKILVLDILQGRPLLQINSLLKVGDFVQAEKIRSEILLDINDLVLDNGFEFDLFTNPNQFTYPWTYDSLDVPKPNKAKKNKAKA